MELAGEAERIVCGETSGRGTPVAGYIFEQPKVNAFEIRYSELKCFQVAYFNLCAISWTLSFSEGFPREKRKRRDENHPTLSLVTFFRERK